MPLPNNWIAECDGYLLMVIGWLLLRKLLTNQLVLYVHPRYIPLLTMTGGVLIVIRAVRATQRYEHTPVPLAKRMTVYGLLLAPVVFGLVLPAKPIGAALLDASNLNSVGRSYGRPPRVDNTASWTLQDWARARLTLTPVQANGAPVDVIGFVYHAPTQFPGEFSVVRYTLACCVADRRGSALAVKWAPGETLPADQWVHVTGKMEIDLPDGSPRFVVTDAHVEPVAQPSDPYLH